MPFPVTGASHLANIKKKKPATKQLVGIAGELSLQITVTASDTFCMCVASATHHVPASKQIAVSTRCLRLVIDGQLSTVASPPQSRYCALGCVRGMEHWAQMLCPLPWLLKHISKFSGVTSS